MSTSRVVFITEKWRKSNDLNFYIEQRINKHDSVPEKVKLTNNDPGQWMMTYIPENTESVKSPTNVRYHSGKEELKLL